MTDVLYSRYAALSPTETSHLSQTKKYRLTLKNSQAIVLGDDISRHDSFRLAPAPRLALDEESATWIRSISYREIASRRNGGWGQRNNAGRGRRGVWIHGRGCETTGTVEIPISTLRRAQYRATSTRNLQQTSELLVGPRPSRVSSSIMCR